MPTFRITAPNGKTYEVSGPEGSTAEQALAQVQQQLGMRPTRQQIADRIANDPISKGANGLGTDGENFLAGAGKGLTDIVRGAGQLIRKASPIYAYSADALGLPGDQATIDEAKRLDAPLMDTKAGLAGSVVGVAAPAVLTAPVTGTGVVGGAVSGAAMGGSQPVASDDSRAMSILVGGLAGGAAPLLARGASALYGAAKGAIEPFTQAGREAIAGRTLARFGVRPSDVAGLTSSPSATGARASLAEQIQRPEGAAAAAKLQDAIRALDPDIAAKMAAREAENNAARVNTLAEIAGRTGARDAAAEARAAATGPLYQSAFKADSALTPSQLKAQADLLKSSKIDDLMRAPAIQEAMKAAQANAENAGRKMTADGSIEGLHNMKLAIDDMIKDPTTAAQAAKVSALKAARDRLVSVIETLSPEYRAARTTYRDMSRPVNQMDVLDEVLRRGTSNTSDLSGTARLMPNQLTGAVKDEAALIRRATGRRDAGNALTDLLDAPQLAKLNSVVGEVDRAAAVARAGAGPGSPTAQRLASTNLLHQIGLPENMTDNALVQTLMRPVQFGAKLAEPRIQQLLLEVTQNPAMAEQVMAKATPAQRIELQRLISNQALAQGIRSTVPAASLGARNGR